MFNMGDTINTSTPFLDLREFSEVLYPNPRLGYRIFASVFVWSDSLSATLYFVGDRRGGVWGKKFVPPGEFVTPSSDARRR